MGALADILSRQTGRPVVDKTELKGAFDVQLRWSPEDGSAEATAVENAPSIYTALQEQLGLQLRPGKEEVDFLVVDRVKRIPADN
jgi:uncharacterized protein (TIGR03435 family)